MMKPTLPFNPKLLIPLAILAVFGGLIVQQGFAHLPPLSEAQASPIHPTFAFLDAEGKNVLESGAPISTMQTCGQCHNTTFIASHSFHTDLGLSDVTLPGKAPSGRPWDTSNGPFGKWNPLLYRYLSPPADQNLDLGVAEWVRTIGLRHVGGGPAQQSRQGLPLIEIPADSPDARVLAPNGTVQSWDWKKSGVAEMNCFLCHTPNPNQKARRQALLDGRFQWANTATLLDSGVVMSSGEALVYNPDAFDPSGQLKKEYVFIQDPTNENCAQCHGVAHSGTDPLVLSGCSLENWQTATTGQVFAGQRISRSGMNIANKQTLNRPFDIHAERGLKCTSCHYSINNPTYAQPASQEQLSHLQFDPRRLEIGEYLQKPDHNFARGQSAQNLLAPELRGTMRRCESCHNAEKTHTWLPYARQHFAEVSCETCHIPNLYAPAVSAVDWTVLTPQGEGAATCRGAEGNTGTLNDLVTGFQPVLLSRLDENGKRPLAPYNLIVAWFWVYDSPDGERPVRLQDLQAVWLEGDTYHPEVLRLFDSNKDGKLDSSELRLDTPKKQALIASRLSALGLQNPRIQGEIQPYSINHNVARGEWAIGDCRVCHSDTSYLAQPMKLADYVPAEVMPSFVKDANVSAEGELVLRGGALYYQPVVARQGRYVFGHNRVAWVDWVGGLFFLGVLAGVAGHGTVRFLTATKRARHNIPLKRVYIYAVYERFWHWLQTFTIVILLFTGLIIHRPDVFGMFSFSGVVIVHNVMAAILAINAFLSFFYHLVSGEIRQFIPRPYGFFDQAIVQAKYYLQGIFKGDPHPFEKRPDRKLNPLQQVTYFAILNVLLPLQGLTGILMWGVQQWPQIAERLGGLPFLAPFHSLIAWLFGAFIVGHVYLTTTGHEPLASIKAMMMGWEDVEDLSALEVEEVVTDERSDSDQIQTQTV
jgi:thiosulfate reductase cytochrome b subunit